MVLIRDVIVCEVLYVDNNMLLAEHLNYFHWILEFMMQYDARNMDLKIKLGKIQWIIAICV